LGFPEAIEAAFAASVVQTCIVPMIRNSLPFVSYKDRKAVAKDLTPDLHVGLDEGGGAGRHRQSCSVHYDRMVELFAIRWHGRFADKPWNYGTLSRK
jgi:putative transposase